MDGNWRARCEDMNMQFAAAMIMAHPEIKYTGSIGYPVEDVADEYQPPAKRRVTSDKMALPPSIKKVILNTAEVTGLQPDDILGDRRFKELNDARLAIAYIARGRLCYSLTKIGRALRRDHTTILSNLRRAEWRRKYDRGFAHLCMRIEGLLLIEEVRPS